MIVKTTKQILRERGDCIHKDMLDIENDMPLTDAYDSREWVCLSDLKKEIEEIFKEESTYLRMFMLRGLYNNLCNSSEQKGDEQK